MALAQAHVAQRGRCLAAARGAAARPAAVPVPARRRVAAASFQQEGFASDSFKQALQEALSRNSGENAMRASDNYGPSYGGMSPSSRQPSVASPLLQVLATALRQSRATLERLQAEEAEIENLIQREQKQVERLEWLLEKVHQDYAYFSNVQRMLEERG